MYKQSFDLLDIAENYKIFVDTCAFMNVEAESFFKQLTPKLKDNKIQLLCEPCNRKKSAKIG